MMKRTITILAIAILATGCSVYQKYTRPESIKTDGLFGEGVAATDTVTLADIGWRDFFKDPHLQRLIEQGLENNSDMKIAAQRIIQAEASLRTARLSYYPSFAFNPKITSDNYTKRSSNHDYQIPITASWEVDIAGRLWNGKRRAQAAFEQSLIYRKSVQTSVVASIANCYYTLLMLDAQLQVSEATAASWKENVLTMKAMKEAGMTNEASVSQTEANSCSIDASLFDLRYQIIQVENTLALLLGTTPQQFERGNLRDQQICEELLIGVPVQLLSRRADVQNAEYELMQTFYSTNLARAAFYPSLTLTGSGGWVDGIGRAVVSPGSLLFSFVGNLLTTIFDAGRNRANLKIAKAQQEEALITFQQTLLEAGSEVNNAMALCQSARSKTDIRQRQITALESAVNSTRQLMSHSESTYLEVLTAQQTLLSARLSQIADRFDAIQGMVSLYQALGGGTYEGGDSVKAGEQEEEQQPQAPQKRAKRAKKPKK